MPISRMSKTRVIDNHHYASYVLPARSGGLASLDLLEGVRFFEHLLVAGERPYHLAARFFHDDELAWVILVVNGIHWPYASGGWTPGRRLRIPMDVNDVLEKLVK